jgi:hypothetical protein
MPVPATIDDLSTTESSNFPAGTETPKSADNYLRAHASFIAQLRDEKADIADLASTASFLQLGTSAVAQSLDSPLKTHVNSSQFGVVPGTGVTMTAKFQAMFDAAATHKFHSVYIEPGEYLLTCEESPSAYAAAVVLSGLKNIRIFGSKGTKLIQSTAGAGATEYGFFRLEECENVEMFDFEMDGSGIVNDGVGGNRSRGIIFNNFDLSNNAIELAPNKGLHFHHLKAVSMGGFIGSTLRNAAYAEPVHTLGLKVHDCETLNIKGQDHCVGVNYTDNIEVLNNRFINDPPWEPTYPGPVNMAVDISAGCHGARVEDNYVYGYVYGMKSETHTAQGPGLNEMRPSKNVKFLNNVLEELGHPVYTTWPGPVGSLIFGIKLNSQGAKAEGNRISKRTINVTTGGLGIGVLATNTHSLQSLAVVRGNEVEGALYGVLHNDTADSRTNRTCFTLIEDNQLNDAGIHGVVAQSNCRVSGNTIRRALKSAISVQLPDMTYVNGNIAINCAVDNNDIVAFRVVYYQEGTGTFGYLEFKDNQIHDSRGASAAHYGYFIRAFPAGSANKLGFRAGYTQGLLTSNTWDKYFSEVEGGMLTNGTLAPAPRLISTTNTPTAIAPWNGMAWNAGDRAIKIPPVVGQPKAWACTVAGTPGTWVSEGNL